MKPLPTLSALTRELPDYNPNALSVESARQLIQAMVRPVSAIEKLALRDALDRVLARDIISPIDVPAHDNSAMDGYALRGQDLQAQSETELRVIGRAHAGHSFNGSVGPGEAVRVMTGAVMPQGADTVVVQELVTEQNSRILVPAGQKPGQNRRCRGEDLQAGTPALMAGHIIGPAELGLMASLGIAEVPVRRSVRVDFFSTGDELRSIGEPLGEGQIYDSNRYTLYGMLRRLGVELIDLGVVPDDSNALRETVRSAAHSADAVISSAGVSVGEADHTRSIMEELGEVCFWTIAMRPGRPLAFGRIGEALYFGLPGNPVAVMITFLFFAREALQRLAGAQPHPQPTVLAHSETVIRKRPGRTEYQRGILSRDPRGYWQVRITGSQGSGVLRSMSEANCIIVLGHDQADVAAGDKVECLAFDGLL